VRELPRPGTRRFGFEAKHALRYLTLTSILVLGACGDDSAGSFAAPPVPYIPASGPNRAAPPQAAVDPIYASFLPPELCAMQRRDVRSPLPTLVTARYEKDDLTLHVNIGKVEDLELGRGLYQRDYERVVRGGWGIYTRSWTLESGEQNREACVIVRNSINVCLDSAARREPPDPAPCLLELHLAGLVDLAKSSGAPSGLNDLDFTYTEDQWRAHEESLRATYVEYTRACRLHASGKRAEAAAALAKSGRDDQPIDAACRMLEETRRDCERDAFAERLAETDIHLDPNERQNFRRTWDITCKLAGKPR
jgi:hypothetical protein